MAVVDIQGAPPGEGRFKGAAPCLLYTSDAADERSSVDLGGRRIIKKKKKIVISVRGRDCTNYKRIRSSSTYNHRRVN